MALCSGCLSNAPSPRGGLAQRDWHARPFPITVRLRTFLPEIPGTACGSSGVLLQPLY